MQFPPLLSPTNEVSGQNSKKLKQVSAGEAFRTYYAIKHPGVSVEALFAVTALKKGRIGSETEEKHKPIPWYVREIGIQNWIDENPQGQNLDGVDVTLSPASNKKTRLTIKGNWAFPSFQALTAIATGKANDNNSAGGLGIGLKESSRDLLEHKIIDNLTVIGEGWSVTYRIPPIEEVQKVLLQHGVEPPEAYLLSELRELNSNEYEAGTCSYVIETDNEEFIKTFAKLKDMAPHKDHPSLQNPDYHYIGIEKKTKNGVTQERPCNFRIKWHDSLKTRGELFIQGQPWSYLSNVNPEEGFFKGAEGVTLELGASGKFHHDSDRNPLNQYAFKKCIEKLTKTMNSNDRKVQLVKSFPIWSQHRDETDSNRNRNGAFILLEQIVEDIQWDFANKFTLNTLKELFPGKDFIAINNDVTEYISDEEIAELKRQGKTICPKFFTALGVPLYQKPRPIIVQEPQPINLISEVHNRQPNSKAANVAFKEVMQNLGIEVDYTILDISSNDHRGFFIELQNQLRSSAVELKLGKDGELEFIFNQNIAANLMMKPFFSKIIGDELLNQKTWIQTIRNLIFWGLENKVLQYPSLIAQLHLATFNINYDSEAKKNNLMTRIIPFINTKANEERFSFKLNDEDLEIFKTVFSFDEHNIWKPEYNPPTNEVKEKTVKNGAELAIADALAEIQRGTDPLVAFANAQEALVTLTERMAAEAAKNISVSNDPTPELNKQEDFKVNSTIVVKPIPAKKSKLALVTTSLIGLTAATTAVLWFSFMDNLLTSNVASKPVIKAKIDPEIAVSNSTKIKDKTTTSSLPHPQILIANIVTEGAKGIAKLITTGNKTLSEAEHKLQDEVIEVGQSLLKKGTKLVNETEKLKNTTIELAYDLAKRLKRIDTSKLEKEIAGFTENLPTERKDTSDQDEFTRWSQVKTYGDAPKDAEYTKGDDIATFVEKFNSHGIETDTVQVSEKDKALAKLKQKIEAAQSGKEHQIKNFKIVDNPEHRHLVQLEILKNFLHEATDVKIDTPVFIFTGNGAKGVNFQGKGIGLHKSLFDGPLAAILEVQAHEVAHNYGGHNNPNFYNTMQALLGGTIQRLFDVASKTEEERTESDKKILSLKEEWDLKANVIDKRSGFLNLKSRAYAGAHG